MPGSSPGERVAEARRDHQRRALFGVRQRRIGADVDERLHQLGVGGQRGEEERRRAELVHARVVQVHLPRHPRVDVRAARRELLHEVEAAQRAGAFRRRIVVADARPADRGDRVERRVAGLRDVRIGAGVQQRRGQLEMRVRHREQQRARARGRQRPP